MSCLHSCGDLGGWERAQGQRQAGWQSVRVLGLETGRTQACLGFLEVLVCDSLTSGFHVKGSFLVDNKFWSLRVLLAPSPSYTFKTL